MKRQKNEKRWSCRAQIYKSPTERDQKPFKRNSIKKLKQEINRKKIQKQKNRNKRRKELHKETKQAIRLIQVLY